MSAKTNYPEGSELTDQIGGRHRRGTILRTLFQSATIIGIIALAALLYNVINSSFGLTAVQNAVDPEALTLAYDEDQLLRLQNIVSSEDDNRLAAEIANNPNAIGFFGYAYFSENQASLKALAVDGSVPSAATVEDGSYPLARPLYIYVAEDALGDKPEVAGFVDHYLSNVNGSIEEIGYFPVASGTYDAAVATFLDASGTAALSGAVVAEGTIAIAGSSTVYPLTQALADDYVAAGYGGEITVDSIGSSAGLAQFCTNDALDIANASRAINQAEFELCRSSRRTAPIELRVGTDALAIVVSEQNHFLTDVTQEQLLQIFTSAQVWSDVDPNWPNEPIVRYVPGINSGTLDFFTETIFDRSLEDLSKVELTRLLLANVSAGLGRNLERQQRFFAGQLVWNTEEQWSEVCGGIEPPAGCTLPERDLENVYNLVIEQVVEPEVVRAWPLVDSIFRRSAIEAEAAAELPNAEVSFRSWLTPQFLVAPQSSQPEEAGIRTAIFGTLWVVGITLIFSFPVGVGAAIYLEEYADDTWINRLLQTNISNLAGVPSIIYGMLGLTIFVRVMEPITSGALFGVVEDATTANGRTVLSAGLTLGLLILPVIIINAQEAIRAVPNSIRQAGMALGATKWQTIWSHVLPSATSGILTGTILSISRALGETAPLVVVGASTFIVVDPSSPFAKFTTMTIQIFQWTSRPQAEFRNIAAAGIIVLLVMLLSLNSTAIVLRNRAAKRRVGG